MDDDNSREATDEEYEEYLLGQLKIVTDPNNRAHLQSELEDIQNRIIFSLANKQREEEKRNEAIVETVKEVPVIPNIEVKDIPVIPKIEIKEVPVIPIEEKKKEAVIVENSNIQGNKEQKKEYFTKRGIKNRKESDQKKIEIEKTEKQFSHFAELLKVRVQGLHFRDKSTYIYNGRYYERDDNDSITRSILQNFADELHMEIDDALITKAIGVWQRRNTVIDQTREQLLYKNRFKLCVDNGIFDINKMMLLDFDSDVFVVNGINVRCDPNITDCPKIMDAIIRIVIPKTQSEKVKEWYSGLGWTRFINEKGDCLIDYDWLTKEEKRIVNTVFEIFGYCLYADYPYHYLFIFHGPNDSGKSTLLKLLKKLLGDGYCAVSPYNLDKRFHSAGLHGKYANICGDLPFGTFNSRVIGELKGLVGEDAVHGEFKFCDPFTFYNYAKILFSTNTFPRVIEEDLEFVIKKVFLVHCPNGGFPEIRDFIENLCTKDELTGLFNKAIDGLKRLLTNDKFTIMPSIERTRKYFDTISMDGGRNSKGEHYTMRNSFPGASPGSRHFG